MHIWVDADACPNAIKDILTRLVIRTKVNITFVANHFIKLPPSKYISFLMVEPGFDRADNEIIKRCASSDIIISSDIILIDAIISKNAHGLSSRGSLFTKENIKSRLAMRDFADTLRSAGTITGGPPPLSNREKQDFINNLEKLLRSK